MRALIIVIVTIVAAARSASADPDDAPYGCGKPTGSLSIRFKPELELKELVSWAMGFSCKRIIYKADIASRAAKVTMLTPGKLKPGEAWSVFTAALDAMGLAAVNRGEVLEIVESATAKAAAI